MIIINKSEQQFLKSIFSLCKKNRLSFLRSIKVKTNELLDTVVFYATDLQTVVKYERVMLKDEQHCREFNLPYAELAAKISNGAMKVIFDTEDKDNEFVIQNGMLRKTVCDDPENPNNAFPPLDLSDKTVCGSLEVPYEVLVDMAPLASDDESRLGIDQCWCVGEDAVFCTDGRRLVYYDTEYRGDKFTVRFFDKILTTGIVKRFDHKAVLKVFGKEEPYKQNDGTTEMSKVLQNGMLCLSNTNETLQVYDCGCGSNPNPPNYKCIIPSCAKEDKKKIVFNNENLQGLRELVNQGAGIVYITPEGIYATVNGQKLEIKMPICCELPLVAFTGAYLDSVIEFTGVAKLELQDAMSPAELHGTDSMSKRHAIIMICKTT